jgi:hypothetical protein
VTIEKRQIWRIGAEIQSKRTKLNEMKKDLRAQDYKTFYGHNSKMFIISYSVCPWQAFTA